MSMRMIHRPWRLGACLVAVLGTACASPALVTDRMARTQGASTAVVTGAAFRHVVYQRTGAAPERIHVYIGGDGTPWHGGRRPARDPTPRRPLALELMARDDSPALYLGRPCYHGLAREDGCEARWWTFERYAPKVVESMAAALGALLHAHPEARVTLIGYSGGGVLALLLADAMARVDRVVTVAANLDIDAWSEAHGYLPLTGSTNPAARGHWRPGLHQLHLAGARDRIVPLHVTGAFTERVADAELRIYDGFDHVCCWVDIWPDPLHEAEGEPR